MNRETRNLQNSKQKYISDINYYPAEMQEGEILFAFPKGKLLRLYKKIRGMVWWLPFTRDGNYIFEGNVKVGGKINGVDISAHYHTYYFPLLFDYNAEITGTSVTTDAKTVDGATNNNGYRMLRAGTITGISIQYRCTESASVIGYLYATVQKNKVNSSMLVSGSVTATGNDLGNSTTSNSFTFSAGDRINVELFLSCYGSAATVEDIAIMVEVRYDSSVPTPITISDSIAVEREANIETSITVSDEVIEEHELDVETEITVSDSIAEEREANIEINIETSIIISDEVVKEREANIDVETAITVSDSIAEEREANIETPITISDEVAAKILDVTAPNGGEVWLDGENHDITWNYMSGIANVKIEYSVDNGANWSPVINSTPCDGTYNWLIPNKNSNQCLIKISDADDAAIFDISDAVFIIAT